MTSPFDLACPSAYRRWRDGKLACRPMQTSDLMVEVADPRALQTCERQALLARCASSNMAIYRSPVLAEDKNIVRLLASQLGLQRLDGNWLADEDGISRIAVATHAGERAAFIPYTNRPIKWHTDGYYHPGTRQIRAMILHCVHQASHGGETALMDHEVAYIAMRDANPEWVRALMAARTMIIPQRLDEDGIARPEQTGPVFSLDPQTGELHMRYTARTRSVLWRDDSATREAVAFLTQLLSSDSPHIFRLRLQPGMGLVCNNVLHDRAGFDDNADRARLLYRARYLDRIVKPSISEVSAKATENLNKKASNALLTGASSY